MESLWACRDKVAPYELMVMWGREEVKIQDRVAPFSVQKTVVVSWRLCFPPPPPIYHTNWELNYHQVSTSFHCYSITQLDRNWNYTIYFPNSKNRTKFSNSFRANSRSSCRSSLKLKFLIVVLVHALLLLYFLYYL